MILPACFHIYLILPGALMHCLLRLPRGYIELLFTKLINPVSLEEFHHKPTHRFVMPLPNRYKVKTCEDELHGPPVVALSHKNQNVI